MSTTRLQRGLLGVLLLLGGAAFAGDPAATPKEGAAPPPALVPRRYDLSFLDRPPTAPSPGRLGIGLDALADAIESDESFGESSPVSALVFVSDKEATPDRLLALDAVSEMIVGAVGSDAWDADDADVELAGRSTLWIRQKPAVHAEVARFLTDLERMVSARIDVSATLLSLSPAALARLGGLSGAPLREADLASLPAKVRIGALRGSLLDGGRCVLHATTKSIYLGGYIVNQTGVVPVVELELRQRQLGTVVSIAAAVLPAGGVVVAYDAAYATAPSSELRAVTTVAGRVELPEASRLSMQGTVALPDGKPRLVALAPHPRDPGRLIGLVVRAAVRGGTGPARAGAEDTPGAPGPRAIGMYSLSPVVLAGRSSVAPARPEPSWPGLETWPAQLTFADESRDPELEAVETLLPRSVSPSSWDADGVWQRIEARWLFVRQSRAVQAEVRTFLRQLTARAERRWIAEVFEVAGSPLPGAVIDAAELAAREKRGKVRRVGAAVSFDGAAARVEAVTARAYVMGTEGASGGTGLTVATVRIPSVGRLTTGSVLYLRPRFLSQDRVRVEVVARQVDGTITADAAAMAPKGVVLAERVRRSRRATAGSVTGPVGAALVVGGDDQRTIAVRVRAWK